MSKLVLAPLCLVLPAVAASASPVSLGTAAATSATSRPKAADICGASEYRYLLGKSIEEAHSISGYNYRIVANPSGASDQRRLTIVIDPRSNIIQQVACG